MGAQALAEPAGRDIGEPIAPLAFHGIAGPGEPVDPGEPGELQRERQGRGSLPNIGVQQHADRVGPDEVTQAEADQRESKEERHRGADTRALSVSRCVQSRQCGLLALQPVEQIGE